VILKAFCERHISGALLDAKSNITVKLLDTS